MVTIVTPERCRLYQSVHVSIDLSIRPTTRRKNQRNISFFQASNHRFIVVTDYSFGCCVISATLCQTRPLLRFGNQKKNSIGIRSDQVGECERVSGTLGGVVDEGCVGVSWKRDDCSICCSLGRKRTCYFPRNEGSVCGVYGTRLLYWHTLPTHGVVKECGGTANAAVYIPPRYEGSR